MTGRCLVLALLPLAACVGEDTEQQIGDQIAAEIDRRVLLIEDPVLTGYVSRIGSQLARASARPDVHYTFHIVNTGDINAFAIPGGHIYVNRGLIEHTENASELSGILAHEIGHVAARHGAQMLERRLRTGTIVSALYRLLPGGEPGLLKHHALDMGGALWSAAHSRADELEADQLAVRTLISAGVDPAGIVTLLNSLITKEERHQGIATAWFSTHPMSGERARRTGAEIQAFRGDVAPDLVRNTEAYTRFRTRLRLLPPAPVPVHSAPL